MTEYLTISAVERIVGLKRARIYQLVAAGGFPAQIKTPSGGARWLKREVEAWLRGGPKRAVGKAEQKGDARCKALLVAARARAKQEGAEFSLTLADVEALLAKSSACPVFGRPWGKGEDAATLERVDQQGGYARTNTVVVSKRAQRWLAPVRLERWL